MPQSIPPKRHAVVIAEELKEAMRPLLNAFDDEGQPGPGAPSMAALSVRQVEAVLEDLRQLRDRLSARPDPVG